MRPVQVAYGQAVEVGLSPRLTVVPFVLRAKYLGSSGAQEAPTYRRRQQAFTDILVPPNGLLHEFDGPAVAAGVGSC